MSEDANDGKQTQHDVLIQASPGDLAHKWAPKVPEGHECYWTVSGTPRQTAPGQRVWFVNTLGDIFAWGEIMRLEDGRLWFDAAHETHVPALDDAPTRGFTYIEPLLPRLQEADWHTDPSGEIVVEGSA